MENARKIAQIYRIPNLLNSISDLLDGFRLYVFAFFFFFSIVIFIYLQKRQSSGDTATILENLINQLKNNNYDQPLGEFINIFSLNLINKFKSNSNCCQTLTSGKRK